MVSISFLFNWSKLYFMPYFVPDTVLSSRELKNALNEPTINLLLCGPTTVIDLGMLYCGNSKLGVVNSIQGHL